MKKKILIWGLIILAALVVLLVIYFILLPFDYEASPGSEVGPSPEIEGESVVLITDKTEYEKREEVKITIKNNTDGQIEFWAIGIGQIEYKENANIWNVIRFDIDCPCLADCKKAPTYLNPGEKSEFIWNQKDDSCEQVNSGRYKARVDWFDPTAEYRMGENPASVSNEFIIKTYDSSATIDEISGIPCTYSNNPCPEEGYMCYKVKPGVKSINCDEVECVCYKYCNDTNDCPQNMPVCSPMQILGAMGICVEK